MKKQNNERYGACLFAFREHGLGSAFSLFSEPNSKPFMFFIFIKADVSRAESECIGIGSERHVLCLAGLRVCGQPQVEVCERGVGPRRQTRAPDPKLCLHPSGLAKFWGSLDESSRLLQ